MAYAAKVIVTLLVCSLVAFIVGLSIRAHLERQYRGYYESGAHAVALYHKYRGTYGSRAYRDAAFKWGDPQDEDDLKKIEEIMSGGLIP